MISKLFIYLIGVFVSVHYAVNPPNIKLNYSNSADSGKSNQGESLLIVPALTLDSGRENNSDAALISVRQENINNEFGVTIINHGWGIYSGYMHQSEILIKTGDTVETGQLIGLVGGTGRVTGPHLHWEIWAGGVQVDPMDWLERTFPD